MDQLEPVCKHSNALRVSTAMERMPAQPLLWSENNDPTRMLPWAKRLEDVILVDGIICADFEFVCVRYLRMHGGSTKAAVRCRSSLVVCVGIFVDVHCQRYAPLGPTVGFRLLYSAKEDC